MMGFVSALSATLAVIVVVMSSLLLSTIMMAASKGTLNISGAEISTEYDAPKFQTGVMNRDLMTQEQINTLITSIKANKNTKISIDCNWGGTYSETISSRYATLYYLILRKKLPESVSVEMLPLQFLESKNSCNLKVE